jgi:hypothetical protein
LKSSRPDCDECAEGEQSRGHYLVSRLFGSFRHHEPASFEESDDDDLVIRPLEKQAMFQAG